MVEVYSCVDIIHRRLFQEMGSFKIQEIRNGWICDFEENICRLCPHTSFSMVENKRHDVGWMQNACLISTVKER